MADVRALLKAKRQEAKITHPFAIYTSSGQLRCAACGTLVKHASAWEGHVGSKIHRTNVARIKEEERLQLERTQAEAEAVAHAEAEAEAEKQRSSDVTKGKRKAEEEDGEDDGDNDMDVDLPTHEIHTKRRRVGPAPNSFPTDFFSDPSRAPIPIPGDSDDEDANTGRPHDDGGLVQPAAPPSAIDLEYERFQQEMLATNDTDHQDTYERATIAVEPELIVLDKVPGGFPAEEQQMDVEAEKEKHGEEELVRRQKEQDDRELIMDRLMDEERAQEEADQRVAIMKARLEALKKKRGAARKAKEPQPT